MRLIPAPYAPYGHMHEGQVVESKMLGMPPHFDAAMKMRTSVLTIPNARITQEIPETPRAKSANKVTTRKSLNMRIHFRRVQHRQNVIAHGQQQTAIQMIRRTVATAEQIRPATQRPK